MTKLRDIIIGILERRQEATDRQLSEAIFGSDAQHQTVNGECRYLGRLGVIDRHKGVDGIIRNFPINVRTRPRLHLVE